MNQPSFSAGTALLLTDGTVLCQDAGAADWWRLFPDASGSYVRGSWSAVASGPNSPLWFASAVLADGRVFVAGGEYNNGVEVELLAAEIYDPLTDRWRSIATPAGWTSIGDAVSCVLPDGRVIIGSVDGPQCAVYNPATNGWKAAASKHNATTNEETWTLLPDGTILTADCFGHPASEKYVIAQDTWVSAGSTPVDLVEDASSEIGPAVLLPDRRVFAIGATGHTALYSLPPMPSQPGTWAAGPSFPVVGGQQLGAKDAPACLLPNGRVLCAVGPVDDDYLGPTTFFEFNPATNSLSAVPNPSNRGDAPFTGRLLPLPTGQVLFANQSAVVEVYTPDSGPQTAWKPTVSDFPGRVYAGSVYTLRGTQLNGLSQAASYGDDVQMATNYPLVRIVDDAGRTTYCRTFGHSSMGVATGSATVQTSVLVPPSVTAGRYRLQIVANGIASDDAALDVIGPARLRASTVSWVADRLDVFVHGSDDVLHHKWFDAGAWNPSQTGFESLGGTLNGAPVAPSWGAGRLDVFVRATDDGLDHKWFDAGAWNPSLTGFEALGGTLNGQPVAVSWAPGRLDVFARGAGDALHHKWLEAGAWLPSPTGLESLGGVLNGDPAAVSWGPNRLDLFVRGADNALYHKWFDGSAWHPSGTGYQTLGGALNGDPAAVSWGPNRLDLFVRGADNALYHKWFGGGAWHPSGTGYQSLGGVLTGNPVVVSRGPNRLDVFVRGADNGLYYKSFDGGAWHPSAIGYQALGGVLAGEPGAVSWAPDRLDVFVEGTDRALYHKWWDGSAWHPSVSSFESLGGSIA